MTQKTVPIRGEFEADVLVLGGGAAGLLAARELAKTRKVILLEAADRVGGRIQSLTDPADPLPVELGPEFIHGHVPQTFSLLRESNLIAIDLPDTHVDARDGKFFDTEGDWEQAADVISRLAEAEGPDRSFADFLKEQGDLPEAVLSRAINFVEGFNAARQDDISVLALGEGMRAEEANDGDRQYHLVGPYDRLPKTLAASMAAPSHVVLGARVKRIEWKAGDVRVTTGTPDGPQTYAAPAAVVALPLGVLQRDDVVFDPPLPVEKTLKESLAMGPVVKAIVRFPTPFWEEKQPDLSFVHDAKAAFPTWWTTLPRRTGQLTGWCGGAAADALPKDEPAVRAAAVESLAKIFGRPAAELEKQIERFWLKDWRAAPTGGAYSYVRVGGAAAVNALSNPIDNTLFLAGEHTHLAMIGTVAGALASGRRCADQINDLLPAPLW